MRVWLVDSLRRTESAQVAVFADVAVVQPALHGAPRLLFRLPHADAVAHPEFEGGFALELLFQFFDLLNFLCHGFGFVGEVDVNVAITRCDALSAGGTARQEDGGGEGSNGASARRGRLPRGRSGPRN